MGSIMKFLASLFRLLCSLLVLVVIALYVNAEGNPDVSAFAAQVTGENLLGLFATVNWVSITAVVLAVAALLRLLEIAWNMAFCAALALVIAGSSYMVFGAETALPAALSTNAAVLDFCNLPQTYPVPALIVAGVFALGWLAANAAFRIAFTTILCYALWYGCAVLFHATAEMAAADPALADKETAQSILTFIQAHPWVTAALPGVFFLVYSLLMAFFDSFPSSAKKKDAEEPAKKEEEEKKADAPKAEAKPAAPAAKPTQTRPLPIAKPTQTRPLTVAKPTTTRPLTAKPAAPAAKPLAKPVLPPVPKAAAPQPEVKPATETKPETKTAPAPAAEPKPEAKADPAPAAESKPEAKAEPASAAEPKTEAKDTPAPEAPKAPAAEEAPKAETAPAAESKPEAPAEKTEAPAAPAEAPQA